MKKFTALMLTVISIIGLIWVAIVLVKIQTSPSNVSTPQSSLPKMEVEGQAALSHVHSLSKMLRRIDQENELVSVRTSGPLPQLGVGEKPNSFINGALLSGKPSISIAPKTPTISMIYISTNMQRAVVDGKSYSLGDRLPNGATIKEIAIDQLVLDMKGRRQILKAPKSNVLGSTVKSIVE